MIKFFDLYKQDKIHHKKIISKFKKIISKTNYILGDEVQIFENNFASSAIVKNSTKPSLKGS